MLNAKHTSKENECTNYTIKMIWVFLVLFEWNFISPKKETYSISRRKKNTRSRKKNTKSTKKHPRTKKKHKERKKEKKSTKKRKLT